MWLHLWRRPCHNLQAKNTPTHSDMVNRQGLTTCQVTWKQAVLHANAGYNRACAAIRRKCLCPSSYRSKIVLLRIKRKIDLSSFPPYSRKLLLIGPPTLREDPKSSPWLCLQCLSRFFELLLAPVFYVTF